LSFISAAWGDYGKIIVWEKSKLGNRIMKTYDPVYYFYVPDPNGKYTGIDGTKLKKLTFKRKDEFEMGLRTEKIRYESDFSVMERILMDNYRGVEPPILNTGFIDIEVDVNPEIGFAKVTNAYAPINALTIYKSLSKEYTTLVIPPPNWDGTWTEELQNVLVCENEAELLTAFLELIEDVDILSGWNSEFFDIPYIAKRIERVLGPSAVKKLNFKGSKNEPRWKEVERFGVKESIVELEGRVHLDYLKLFRKFNLEGRPSYALASIADDELDIPKLKYEGNLYSLYRNDFTHFVKYNIRDVEILVRLDKKFKYIETANGMVHEATVNFNSVFGSVNIIDSAIINIAHNRNLIVLDKNPTAGEHVEGAIVMTPKTGFRRWTFSCDIISLYPSVYRSLNLSPEKIIGQFTRNELDWQAIFNETDEEICLRMEKTNELLSETGKNWKEILQQKGWAVSAYGTVLDQSSGEGLLAYVLSYWFNGRKELQAKKKEWANKADEILKSGKTKDSPEYIEAIAQSEYFDMLQGIRKVLLNSSYGATLNEFSRYHDARLGASTTATGRQITTFMIQTIGNMISGNDMPVVKSRDMDGNAQYTYEGNEIIYGDTDSCYASLEGLVSCKEEAVEIADEIVNATNEKFPAFMSRAFLCQQNFNSLIKANREVVAQSAIFQAKKKYMLYIVNLEGKDLSRDDKKSFKTMGGDIKTSTTPIHIKQFLKRVTLDILYEVDKKEIEDYIVNFRNGFKVEHDDSINPLDIATQGSAKVLEEYYQKWSRLEKKGLGKVNLPGHIRASINYNECLKLFNDKDSLPITSGSKIRTVYLKQNDQNFKSMAFPAEIDHFPDWFENYFKVDMKVMEEKLIDAKLSNIFNALDWTVPTVQSQFRNSVFEF
jgi:DNA polymerase elongation subunit (family B)